MSDHIENDNASCSSDDSDIAFASMDFAGVDFDEDADDGSISGEILDSFDKEALEIERRCLLLNAYDPSETKDESSSNETAGKATAAPDSGRIACLKRVKDLASNICNGKYVAALKSESARHVLGSDDIVDQSIVDQIQARVMSNCTTVASAVEAELLGVAAFNLFLQINYTGPSLDDKGITPKESQADGTRVQLHGINPHPIFRGCLKANVEGNKHAMPPPATSSGADIDGKTTKGECDAADTNGDANQEDFTEIKTRVNAYHNAVLTELCVDGDWPCQVCEVPYMLLLARSLLLPLADPQRAAWSRSVNTTESAAKTGVVVGATSALCHIVQQLQVAKLVCARTAVAHQRLLQGDEASATLWDEVEALYMSCVSLYCRSTDPDVTDSNTGQDSFCRSIAARIMLEWGLAEHHFGREGMGKKSIKEAMKFAGLNVEVTGAEGRRTKYQQKATAQYLVKAKSSTANTNTKRSESVTLGESGADVSTGNDEVKSQMIQHNEENILLERVSFVNEDENKHDELSELDLSILLALCLDVKNENPMDGLTAEQMGGYLERILRQHDDWMIYATALLERAWLECERNHARERAILQIQALCDQHTERLTMTQSTFKAAVEDSAPPQERLRNLHHIVYPPRWAMLRDLAERYAKLGVVTSAAEIFVDLELWDEVVECYRAAGKESQAEKIVRRRLAEAETPRMLAALGDLTKDPECFEKALKISNGRFASAHVALGAYYFENGDLRASADSYQQALKVKPLQPAVWFRLGTICMRLDEWDDALVAFTEVVQQEPEEGDAWANIAAIHMQNKDPASAYPAIIESLKQKRTNWRVWVSKLYTCIDLEKYDEALQACNQLLDFRIKKNTSESIPPLEEKCVRAIVGGALVSYKNATESKDNAAIESSRRTLSRVRELLTRLGSTSKSEPWVWEVSAFFNETVGLDEKVFEDLMKEYRALQTIRGWETDTVLLPKVCCVVRQIYEIHRQSTNKEDLVKFKFLLQGVVKKVQAAYFNREVPVEAKDLESLLTKVETVVASMK